MNISSLTVCYKPIILLLFVLFSLTFFGQNNAPPKPKSAFWKKVQFGGGIGLSIGNGYTDITLAPSAIYNFNSKFALGTGIQYSHLKQSNIYTSNLIGGSLIGLYNPIESLQFSLELEEVNVSQKYQDLSTTYKDNFWSTGLFAGAGYRANNVIFGFRYNLFFDSKKNIYGDALMPFVRVYF